MMSAGQIARTKVDPAYAVNDPAQILHLNVTEARGPLRLRRAKPAPKLIQLGVSRFSNSIKCLETMNLMRMTFV